VNLEDIIDAIRRDRICITDHADEEAQADRPSFDEILMTVFQGEIIEEYPSDRPYPSCLIFMAKLLGTTQSTASGLTIGETIGLS